MVISSINILHHNYCSEIKNFRSSSFETFNKLNNKPYKFDKGLKYCIAIFSAGQVYVFYHWYITIEYYYTHDQNYMQS